jgi:hypothetical protein
MAQAIRCDLCGQENAVLMQTNIDNGDVIAIGGSCMVTFLLSTAATILDEMPADHVGQYAEIIAPVVSLLTLHAPAAEVAEVAEPTVSDILADLRAANGDSAADPAATPAGVRDQARKRQGRAAQGG